MVVSDTGNELSDLEYENNPNIAQLFYPVTAGSPSFVQGFAATPSSQASPAADLTLVIDATVEQGTTADQLTAELAGAVLSSAGLTATGKLTAVRRASFVDISVEAADISVPVFSWWLQASMIAFLSLIGVANLARVN